MTSTLFSRGGTSPRTTFPVPHDRTPSTYHCLVGLRHYYLFSDYLMSLDTAHGPISIFGPFIPTITPRNSTLLLLGKKGMSISWWLPSSLLCHFFMCKCLFNCKEACFWCFGIQDTPTFISFGALSPMSYGVMEILQWRRFMGIWAETLLLTFSLLIYIAWRLS